MEDNKATESSDEMEIPPKEDDICEDAPQDQCEEPDRNLATSENQVLPSGRQDTGKNDDEMTTEDNYLIIDDEDDSEDESGRNPKTLEDQDVSSFGQDTSENQQQSSGKSTETSPGQDPTGSSTSTPVLEHSDSSSCSINIKRSYPGESLNIYSTPEPEPYPRQQTTRALSIQNSPIPSPEKQSVETGVRGTPAKRKRTESDSDESGNTKSFRPNLSPSTTPGKSPIHKETRKRRAATPESEEESESLSISPTPGKQKRLRKRSSSSDSDASSSRMPDPEAPTESDIPARNSGESETEEETSIRARKGSTDLESVDNESDSGELGSKIRTDEECDTLRHGNMEEFASVSPEESQSAADAFHPGNETQMLASSQPRPIENPLLYSEGFDPGCEIFPSGGLFSNLHLHEQSNASNMNDPHQEYEPKRESYDEKGEIDGNGSDSLTGTFKSNVKSRSEAQTSLSSINLYTFPRLEPPENREQQVPMEDNIDMPLLPKRSEAIPSESPKQSPFTSGHQSQTADDSYTGNRLNTSSDVTVPGQPTTSSHQPLVTEDFCADDCSLTSSTVAEYRSEIAETTDYLAERRASAPKISKRASDAQNLLLLVLEEIMKLNEEKDYFKRFRSLFHRVNEFFCEKSLLDLHCELLLYIFRKQALKEDEHLFTTPERTLEYQVEESYHVLDCLVVWILSETVILDSSRKFKSIMRHYRTLRCLFEKCRTFWRDNKVRCIQDETSRNRVICKKEKLEKFLLQTKNAFQLLLMHIGEHAKPEDIDEYEKILFEEDKSYLRRRIL